MHLEILIPSVNVPSVVLGEKNPHHTYQLYTKYTSAAEMGDSCTANQKITSTKHSFFFLYMNTALLSNFFFYF